MKITHSGTPGVMTQHLTSSGSICLLKGPRTKAVPNVTHQEPGEGWARLLPRRYFRSQSILVFCTRVSSSQTELTACLPCSRGGGRPQERMRPPYQRKHQEWRKGGDAERMDRCG